MHTPLARWLAALALFLLPSHALAQHTLVPGDTVRVLAPAYHAEMIEGEILRYQADSMAVRDAATGAEYAFPVTAIRALQKNEGFDRRRSVRKWALAGLFIGASVGLVSGPLIAASDDEGGMVGPTLLIGLGGGVLGLGLGAAGGSVFSREHWQRFRTPIVPRTPPAVALGVTLPAP